MSSIIDPSTGTIVKSDRIGRTRYIRQYRQQVLAAFESSSLSAPSFAAHCGIKYPTFAAWITAGKRSTPNRVGDSATFLTAEVVTAVDGNSPLVLSYLSRIKPCNI